MALLRFDADPVMTFAPVRRNEGSAGSGTTAGGERTGGGGGVNSTHCVTPVSGSTPSLKGEETMPCSHKSSDASTRGAYSTSKDDTEEKMTFKLEPELKRKGLRDPFPVGEGVGVQGGLRGGLMPRIAKMHC